MGAIGADGEGEMLLLLSDCSGHHWWQGGGMHALLQRLGRSRPVAILQVLPSWMWRRTALGIGEMVALRNRSPLGGSGGYRTEPLRWWEERPAQDGGAGPLVPVVPLEAAPLAAWSDLVRGVGLPGTTGVRLPARWPQIHIAPAPALTDPAEVAAQVRNRLERFFQRSSAGGQRLLQVMAAAPVLTLPVIRLLQEAMVPGERSPLGMAEVLLSGLVRRVVEEPETRPEGQRNQGAERIQFRFDDGVREALLRWLPAADTVDVVQRVSELVERRWDQIDGVPPFRAYLADPTALPPKHALAPMAAFATATADIIERLGGRYRAYAQKLRETARTPSDDIWPKASFPFEPLEFDTALLLAIPEPEQRRFDWAKQVEEIKLHSVAFETATIQLVPAESPRNGSGAPEKSPRVFVSYSHDSKVHTEWVLRLATHLRAAGVDVGLDRDDLRPGDDWEAYFSQELRRADWILMVCSSAYVRKADASESGRSYDNQVITLDRLQALDSAKVIPLLRDNEGEMMLPRFLRDRSWIDFREDAGYSSSLRQLQDVLQNSTPFSESSQRRTATTIITGIVNLGYREPLNPGPSATTADPPALTMLRIPAGSYLMGSPSDEIERHTDEGPQHEVHLEEFFLARTPITQAQWREVARWQPLEGELAWQRELEEDPLGSEADSRFRGENRPVVNVSWHDAMEFCRRLSKRTGKSYTLPSEARWEYACRAGITTPFHFGATISPELANYDATSSYAGGPAGEYREQTTEVASFPANAWGLHDMHGNVWEWCLDHWHGSYVEGDENAPTDGSAWIKQSAEDGERRLLRGGSWGGNPRSCRSAYRSRYHPGSAGGSVGFRVCCLPQDLFLDP
jgi:formylglycine-generating enzyme required for sulfatase activity